MNEIPSKQDSQEARLGEIYGDVKGAARIFNFFISILLIGLITEIFIVLSTKAVFSAAILAIGVLLVLVARHLVSVKMFEAAAIWLGILLILMNTILATMELGIHNISNFAFPVILIIASLVTSKRTMFFLTFLTVLCIAWLVFGELWGLYTPGVLVRSVPGDFFSASIIVILTAIMVHQMTGAMFKSYSRVHKEVMERRSIEASLRQRDVILEAVTFAAEHFLKTPDWRENINTVLERLGETTNATHAYLFEDHLDAQGVPVTSMRYEWTAPGYPSDLDGPYFQSSPIHQVGFEEQVERLRRGEVRIGTSSTFNPIEKGTMQDLGVKAILKVPIFVNSREWGAIGFDDFEKERVWSGSEVDALKIAAGVLSAAIQHQETEEAVRESERIYRQAIQAAGMVPYYRDYVNNRYAFIGEGISEITGYSSDVISPQIWDQMEVKRVPRGSMAHLTYDEADLLTEQGILNHWECDYLIVNRLGQERWVSDSCIQVRDDMNVRIGVVGILQDITDRKLTEANLQKRESILEAITFSAEQFLKVPDWRASINAVLERLGNELNISHAYLFEKHTGPDGTMLNSIRYEWVAPGQKSDLDNPAYQNAPEHEVEFKRYYSILNRGDPYIGSSSFFNEEEKAGFARANIKAILELRIVVNDKQWGTLGFDDMVNEREWTAMDVDVIKVAGNVLGAAIKRQLDEDALKNELAERMRAEVALKYSEQKFSKAFRSSPDSVTLSALESGLLVEVNDGFQKVFGYSREEAIGRTTLELGLYQNPDDRNKMVQILREQGSVYNLELIGRHRNGSELTALVSVEQIEIGGKPHLITITRDITERKRVEEALRESEARYRSLFEQSHDAVFILDLNARHIAANQRAANMLGYSVEEIQKLSVNELSVELHESENILERMMASEHIPVYQRIFRKKNGEIFPVEINVELVRDDKGNPLHIQSVVRDVTQRKRAEGERERLITELSAKNAELEQFTYTVSHDLKSPLVTINGFLGFLEQDAVSGNIERLKKDTQRIQEAVKKMQRLLSELLELSRIGRMMNVPESIPFRELVDECLSIVHGRLEERGVVVHVYPNLPVIYGDRPRLVEVLQNLMDNAAKYMGDQKNPLIEIGQRGEEYLKPVFFVKDNGMGIDTEYHERVFGLFNKLDAKSEGTGVGLALVKRIVEFHGGRIWVESEAGKGSTFLFTLPAEPVT